MAKQPYIQFYLGDYIKDTRVLPLNVKGGWVDLILAMWDNDPKGELTGTMDDFARIMNCSKEEAILVIQTLKQKKFFDYLDTGDGFMQIISRKQKKMEKLSEIRKKIGKTGGNPKLVNQNDNQKVKLNAEYENEYNTVLETNVVMPLMSKEDFENFRLKLMGEQHLVETLLSTRGIGSMSNLISWIEIFNIHISGEGKTSKNYSEYKKHFKNWILKQDTFGTPPQTKASVKKMVV